MHIRRLSAVFRKASLLTTIKLKRLYIRRFSFFVSKPVFEQSRTLHVVKPASQIRCYFFRHSFRWINRRLPIAVKMSALAPDKLFLV